MLRSTFVLVARAMKSSALSILRRDIRVSVTDNMNKKDVLSEPPSRGPRPDSQETSPLLNAYSDLDHVPTHTENAEDGAALRRNEHDGKNIVYKSSLHVLE